MALQTKRGRCDRLRLNGLGFRVYGYPDMRSIVWTAVTWVGPYLREGGNMVTVDDTNPA